jgi:hypothetical protein
MVIKSISQLCEPFSPVMPLGVDGVKSNVIFGSPRQDCNGTGICQIASFDGVLSLKNRQCRQTMGFVQANPDGTSLRIAFRKTDMCSRLYANHFYKGVFKMSDACPLPQDFRKKTGVTLNNLRAGDYKVHEANGWIHVDLILF